MKPKQEHAPLNILLADDDTDNCFFFDKALKEIPIATHLTTVHDGEPPPKTRISIHLSNCNSSYNCS